MLKAAPTPLEIAMLTTKKWHTVGVHLTVGFLDTPPGGVAQAPAAAHERMGQNG